MYLIWSYRFTLHHPCKYCAGDSRLVTVLPVASELTYSLHGVESLLRNYQFSAIQWIPHIFWKKIFHSRVYKISPTVPFVSHMNQVLPPCQLFKIHFNIVLTSTSGYSTRTPAIRSPHQNHSCTSSASLLATYPTHNIPIYLINRITCDEEHISLTSCVVFPTHL